MRIRAAIAVSAASAAVAALPLTAPQSQAAAAPDRSARCTEQSLTMRAKAAAGDPTVLRVSVTNRGARACVVDRVPTVTFGNLDGAALPVPETRAGTHRLAAGGTAYADVRTIDDPADPEARRVGTVTVAASTSHWGRSFTAGQLGTGRQVPVWEPVATWWQPSAAAADRTVGLG
ncbi:DUF4232 domain-containing protein [Streptomyces echinatus]|uniref:DUF4232 domain-containing protein n=1 Tax=Streptomyces echinatus TaxID=67293 RepID=UPI0037B964F5